MKDILLSLQNYLLSDAIKTALQSSTEFRVQVIEKASEIAETCRIVRPAVLLMETTGYPPCTFSQRMDIRRQVRAVSPESKIVLLCDENAEKDVAYSVKAAKQDGRIDAFFYASVSTSYLIAALDTL